MTLRLLLKQFRFRECHRLESCKMEFDDNPYAYGRNRL